MSTYLLVRIEEFAILDRVLVFVVEELVFVTGTAVDGIAPAVTGAEVAHVDDIVPIPARNGVAAAKLGLDSVAGVTTEDDVVTLPTKNTADDVVWPVDLRGGIGSLHFGPVPLSKRG